MFFDSTDEILKIAERIGFSIFVVPEEVKISGKNCFFLRPDKDKKKISIEAVRDFTSLTLSKQTSDQFFVVEKPETMNPEAANAFLKNLEEPKEKYHFVFLTENPTALLPTILSRAQIYFLREKVDFDAPLNCPDEIKTFAKRLMIAREKDLPTFAKEIADKKDRNFALEVIKTAIELSYKTFFLTKNEKFLLKMPNLLELYENIAANGHIKLHFVADML